jgi:hypothetical protein
LWLVLLIILFNHPSGINSDIWDGPERQAREAGRAGFKTG